MNRTQRLSRVLRRLASVLFGISILALVVSPGIVFVPGFTLDVANHQLRLLDVDVFRFTSSQLGWMLRTVVWASTASSMGAGVLFFGALIRLLHQFEGGTAFSLESVRLMRFLGWLQMAIVPVDLLLFWGFAHTAKALTGHSVSPWAAMAGSSVNNLFFGGVVLLVAYVLEEGFRLKAEQELVI